MPRIFEKDLKINIIEYGDQSYSPVTLTLIKEKISSALSFFIKP